MTTDHIWPAFSCCHGCDDDIDIVILDIGMPGMGGYKCLVRLKEMDPEVKIIIASGYFAQGPVEEAIQSGVADYIAKPFQLDELLAKIRENLPESN